MSATQQSQFIFLDAFWFCSDISNTRKYFNTLPISAFIDIYRAIFCFNNKTHQVNLFSVLIFCSIAYELYYNSSVVSISSCIYKCSI